LSTVSNAPARTNIAIHLSSMAARRPSALAVVVPDGRDRGGRARYTHLTYRQLDQDSNWIAHGLRMTGISRGSRAVVMVPPSLDFFSVVFALFKAGVAPVLIDPGIGLANLGRCCREAAPEVFIGVRKAVTAHRVFGWGRDTLKHRVLVAPGRRGARAGTPTLDDLRHVGQSARERGLDSNPFIALLSADETAAILFTSGSTGPPKGAVYTHAIFQAQVASFRSLYAIEPGEIDLCTFPLFALFAPALGMTAIVPEMDATRPARVDPAKIFQAIDDFGVTNLFGSPALLRRLVQGAEARSPQLSSLNRVVSAGAPVPAKVIDGVARLLGAAAQVHTPYGATEALPVASIGSDEILGQTRARTDEGMGICVGRTAPELEVRIIRIDDAAISTWSDALLVDAGTIGEIVVSGPVVTHEYFHRPEATRLAKIADPARGAFYHRMGDVGYFDGQGRLWFCGRKSQRVIVSGKSLFTVPCEAIFNAHPQVARSALVGVNKRGRVRPVICVEAVRWPSRPERRRLVEELLERAGLYAHTRTIETILFHRSFPVDARHNSKIFREKLAEWAARKLS
jgi:olefin beta-lactone synthetase